MSGKRWPTGSALRSPWSGAALLRSQPAVYRGRVFVGGQDGSVYALDAATGCVHWSTIVQAEVRSGMTVAPVRITLPALPADKNEPVPK